MTLTAIIPTVTACLTRVSSVLVIDLVVTLGGENDDPNKAKVCALGVQISLEREPIESVERSCRFESRWEVMAIQSCWKF
jgi:hypothetical protein